MEYYTFYFNISYNFKKNIKVKFIKKNIILNSVYMNYNNYIIIYKFNMEALFQMFLIYLEKNNEFHYFLFYVINHIYTHK